MATTRPVELIAHRGNALEFPENSLAALRSAVELGARWVEFDVQLSTDRIPLVIHDDRLERTAGIRGCVFDRCAAELMKVDVHEPERFGERHRGVRLPLLSEVVGWLQEQPQVTACVEIKRASLRRFSRETVVEKVLADLQPVFPRCIVISFDLAAVQLARRKGARIGWVLESYEDSALRDCQALQPEMLFCDHERLAPDAQPLWPGPWKWAVYEVDDPQLALALAARGADFIETMAVAPMLEALARPR